MFVLLSALIVAILRTKKFRLIRGVSGIPEILTDWLSAGGQDQGLMTYREVDRSSSLVKTNRRVSVVCKPYGWKAFSFFKFFFFFSFSFFIFYFLFCCVFQLKMEMLSPLNS